MRRALVVASSLALFLAMLGGAGFLVRAGRFRLPAMSVPGLAILALAIGWIAWRARRGSSWARRLEAGLLLVWGAYLLVAPTLFDGWTRSFARLAGIALAGWGIWLVARLALEEIRETPP